MSKIIRVAALIVVFVAGACVSSNEVAQHGAVSAADVPLVFGEMHAAIAADKGNGNVFEYN
jgi:hypothetical protein